jgi:histidyl-tRNA synthetase
MITGITELTFYISYNNHFYKNGMVFEAVVDTLDMKKKDVLAVGGRYVKY